MDLESIAAIIFLITVGLFLLKNKKKVQLQKMLFPLLYFIMYRTKLGLKQMDSIAKNHPKFVKFYGNAAIFVGFLGMIFVSVFLIYNLIKIFFIPASAGAVSVVLPFNIKGVAYVPFFYWIISIFILAVVHEFSHGMLARLSNVKIKSSGFAFFSVLIPILPAAFVEPDEKKLIKKPAREQLAIFAAGSFANIVLCLLCVLFVVFVFSPVASKIVKIDGLKVVDYMQINGSSPLMEAGIQKGEIIKTVNGVEIIGFENLTRILENKTEGDIVKIKTDKKEYDLALRKSDNITVIGGYLSPNYSDGLSIALSWFAGLMFWMINLNLGIGLINLLPLGPIDGGRMLKVVIDKFVKNKNKALKLWSLISFLFLIVLLLNILSGFFRA